jgi:hypothetical protein
VEKAVVLELEPGKRPSIMSSSSMAPCAEVGLRSALSPPACAGQPHRSSCAVPGPGLEAFSHFHRLCGSAIAHARIARILMCSTVRARAACGAGARGASARRVMAVGVSAR